MSTERNSYYDVLEIQPSATLQDVHGAYNRTKNAYTGDSAALYSLMTQNECDEIVNQIEEAYSVLGVPDKRRQYDKARGFNQNNTPQGFNESIEKNKDYEPNNSLDDYISQNTVSPKTVEREFEYKENLSPKEDSRVAKVAAFKKFSLNYSENSDFEQEIESCTEFTGEFLRQIREYKSVSIERMSEMTRISKTYIKTIENDEFSKMPADVYTRGFVYQYAKCLKLNPDHVAASYLSYYKRNKNLQAES